MDDQRKSNKFSDNDTGGDELSKKLRDDTLLFAHLRSQGQAESCQEDRTTTATQKYRKWFWLLLVVSILSILVFGVILLVLSYSVEPGPTTVTVEYNRNGTLSPVPVSPAKEDQSYTIQHKGRVHAVQSVLVCLIPWLLLTAIVCGLICIVIYAVGRRKNLESNTAPTGELPPMQQVLNPHRGGFVLALGIIGLVFFPGIIFSIMAWVMANRDLRQMNAGAMDPAGRGMTQAGKICGIIGTVLICGLVGITLLINFKAAPVP